MPKIRTNFEGLVRLLARNLYPEADVFIRELLQNGHDAVQLRRHQDKNLQGRLEIVTDARQRTLRFIDNGLGMDQQDIEEFLSTIGTSGTSERTREWLAEGDRGKVIDTIGQFGIGFLSAFVVADKIEVTTRKRGSSKVLRWISEGHEDYELEELPEAGQEVGTEVRLTLRPDRTEMLDGELIRKTIRKYADFLPFGVYVDGNGPVNTIDAPWHKPAWNSPAAEKGLADFLNQRYPDSPLHVIPIDFAQPRAVGALYISDRHVPGINTPGLIDIFQNRMCIRINDQELLPEWAKFVRGVIDSPALTPTAARDNVQRDGVYNDLRRQLGRRIVESLLELSEKNPTRFHRLCEWHHYHLKGMAYHHDDFFDAVVEYLPFETSDGTMDLRTYVRRQNAPAGAKVPIYFFSFGHDSNQYFELCKARQLLAINTGRPFEEELVRKFVQRNSRTLELRQLDTLHDERIFELLSEEEQRRYQPLEDAVRRALHQVRVDRVNPVARRFKPDSMSGALIGAERSQGISALEQFLKQPLISEGLGSLAQDALTQLTATPLTLYLNVGSPIVQHLAAVHDLNQVRYQKFLVGLYNAAVLNAQHQMTPHNAQVFYHQLHSLISQGLDLEQRVETLELERENLRRQVLESSSLSPATDRDWIRCFVMMSYESRYDPVERALREVLEGPPYFFELELARDRHHAEHLNENLRHHLADADLYLADISEHSPNVFLELGWPHFDPALASRPKVLLRSRQGEDVPVDLQGLIRIEYDDPALPDLADFFREELEKKQALEALLSRRQARRLHPATLAPLPFLASGQVREAICRALPTFEALLAAEQLPAELVREHSWLAGVLGEIQNHLRRL